MTAHPSPVIRTWRRMLHALWLILAVAGVAGARAQAPVGLPAQPGHQVAPPGSPAAAPGAALPQATTERQVKAAFLYKFLGYTEFPPAAFGDAASPVLIGVAGSDDMLAELARTVVGRTLSGRPIVVKPVRDGDNPGPLHLLFVAGSDGPRVSRTLRNASGAMLLVTECEFGLQMGSVINFKMVN